MFHGLSSGLRAVVALVMVIVSMAWIPTSAVAADEMAGFTLCPGFVSAEQRLLMEQWAPDGNCRKPTRTRIVDRLLGYSCLEERPGDIKCRGHWPHPESRAFDTAKHFRCLDLDAHQTDDGLIVTQMREWIAPQPKQCDWDPHLNILASEIDFANSLVCVAGLCLPIQRLSAIGKTRLRLMIERSFRELGLILDGSEAQASANWNGLVLTSPLAIHAQGFDLRLKR